MVNLPQGVGRGGGLWAALGLALLIAGCPPNPPPPRPPGTFLGSFSFTGQLVLAGQDGGDPQLPATTCELDGGPVTPVSSLAFYASLSEEVDAGTIGWQIDGALPQIGTLAGASFRVVTRSPAPMPNCGCVAEVTETIVGSQLTKDGGALDGAFSVPILTLAGWIDDRLSADPSVDLSQAQNEGPACLPDAGAGCALGCDLVYVLTGVPGQP